MGNLIDEVKKLEYVTTYFSPERQDFSILVMLDQDTILRFYLVYTPEVGELKVDSEIQTFKFRTKEEAGNFAERLPYMSALELMLSMENVDLKEAPTQ